MYSEVFKLQSNLLKSLASPKRLEIISLLRDQSVNVSEMQSMLGLPQANLSQHLMVLREAGVVVTQKKGKQVYYRLTHSNFIEANDLIREILVEKYQGSELANEMVLKMKDLVPVTKDLVCGMRVSPKTATAVSRYQKELHYFCASGCKVRFDKNPDKFIKKLIKSK
jgi:DNA-binding transcriptional ArsR family regulator